MSEEHRNTVSIFVHIDTDAEALSISDKQEQRSAECWSVKFIEPAGFGTVWTNSESEHILNLKVTGLFVVFVVFEVFKVVVFVKSSSATIFIVKFYSAEDEEEEELGEEDDTTPAADDRCPTLSAFYWSATQLTKHCKSGRLGTFCYACQEFMHVKRGGDLKTSSFGELHQVQKNSKSKIKLSTKISKSKLGCA